jgi:hypothetical protein
VPFHVTISDHGGDVKADAPDAVIGYVGHFFYLCEKVTLVVSLRECAPPI